MPYCHILRSIQERTLKFDDVKNQFIFSCSPCFNGHKSWKKKLLTNIYKPWFRKYPWKSCLQLLKSLVFVAKVINWWYMVVCHLVHPSIYFDDFQPATSISTYSSIYIYLVGGAITILKNMTSSVGMTSHIIYEMENNPNVWNHQPAYIWYK